MLCFVVECPYNLTRAMTREGESSTRCMLHHDASQATVARVLGLDRREVRLIERRALLKLRRGIDGSTAAA